MEGSFSTLILRYQLAICKSYVYDPVYNNILSIAMLVRTKDVEAAVFESRPLPTSRLPPLDDAIFAQKIF